MSVIDDEGTHDNEIAIRSLDRRNDFTNNPTLFRVFLVTMLSHIFWE